MRECQNLMRIAHALMEKEYRRSRTVVISIGLLCVVIVVGDSVEKAGEYLRFQALSPAVQSLSET